MANKTTCCILVADGSRARLFTAELASEKSARFEEREVLLEPEHRLSGRETFSDAKSGRNRAPHGGPAHGYDDHRDGHREEVERRFAKRIAHATAQLVEQHGSERLVVVADPRLLGMLRKPLESELPGPVSRVELREDLSNHPPAEIRTFLEEHGVLPPVRRLPRRRMRAKRDRATR